jgi:hypothetical protein
MFELGHQNLRQNLDSSVIDRHLAQVKNENVLRKMLREAFQGFVADLTFAEDYCYQGYVFIPKHHLLLFGDDRVPKIERSYFSLFEYPQSNLKQAFGLVYI